jgi:hypothetical protein
MGRHRVAGEEHPGISWGPFTLRIPFYHTRLEWPDLLQGIFVAGATGMAVVPILTHEHYGFGLSFEEAMACIFIQGFLICTAAIVFGEPYAPGMITPALPLMMAFVLGTDSAGVPLYPTPEAKWQVLAAVSMNFAVLLLLLGVTGLGRWVMERIPDALKGGIILGAAIAALKRVFVEDAPRFLLQQPVTTTLALGVCLLLIFSAPVQRYKARYVWLAKLAGLGLLPGFVVAAVVGPFVPAPGGGTEIMYDVEWGILWLPFGDLLAKTSPFAIGWPSLSMFIDGLPLALMGYVILFGDIVTGNEILRAAQPARPDEKIRIDISRSHLSIGIRNAAMALVSPLFPQQGALWTGVHVVIVQRWVQGRQAMDSLFSGISSYYVFGVPVLYTCLPLVTALRPMLGIALSLTLVLTGFACAYVAMGIPRTQIERGVVLLSAVALAVFSPWIGMAIAIVATFGLVGFRPHAEPAR